MKATFSIIYKSQLEGAHRLDAEYYQPEYLVWSNQLKRFDSLPLEKLAKKIDVGYVSSMTDHFQDDGIPLLRTQNVREFYADLESDLVYIDDNFSNKNLETLLEDDFVFAGIGATLGKTGRIPKELEGSFYSNNTARFRLKDSWKNKVNPHYLQIVLQSSTCQWQFEQKQAQTAQAKISDEALKTVLIPILSKSTQQKIANWVKKSHQARQKSKELLEKAKRKVEEMIKKE